MEQFEVVFKPVEGYEHVVVKGENGELIVRLVPNSSEKLQDNATCSQKEVVVESVDKTKFFTQITAEDREKVKNWLAEQKGKTEGEKLFLKNVEEALKRVGTDYWIATLEPSVVARRIYYAEGEEVGVGYSGEDWNKMAKEYAPERLSRLSNEYELYIWYALRIVNGLWTLDYVANDSSSAGNYRNAHEATHSMEKTGARKCGGFCDGQGNSYKIVTREGGYALVGGGYYGNGNDFPVADVDYDNHPDFIQINSSGVLVLTK